MNVKTQIELVEAAYAMDLGDEAWQRRLTKLVADEWKGVVYSFRYDASDPSRFAASGYVGVDASAGLVEGAQEFHSQVTPEMARLLFGQGPIITSLNAVLEANYWDLLTEEYGLSHVWPETKHDQLGLRTLDPSGKGLTFAMPYEGSFPLSAREQVQWTQIGVHIAAADRLRRTLTPCREAEAVMDLDGRCAHAEGDARSNSSRETLRDAVRAVMRARGDASLDEGEVLSLWQGLVSGRWSLIDRFDADGRHYLVAHKNAPEVTDPRAFTARENQVAGFLAMGHSNKLIAYTLGLKTSTVGTHVVSILRKLGVATRVEGVRLLAAARQPG